jgi:hypothetical protein
MPMAKLKISALLDEKPVKVSTELPAPVYRNLRAYAEALAGQSGQPIEPVKLIAPMLARFMATDREFAKLRRSAHFANGELKDGVSL